MKLSTVKQLIYNKNIPELKKYLETTDKSQIDYFPLLESATPRNYEIFKILLASIPDIWVKAQLSDWDKNYLEKHNHPLAVKISHHIQHYADDSLWNMFAEKLGKDINLHDKEKYVSMWSEILIDCRPAIFSEFIIHDIAEKSLGRKNLDNIYMNKIDKLYHSHDFFIEMALKRSSIKDISELIIQYSQKENFNSVMFIKDNSKLTDNEIRNIKIDNAPIVDYLKNKLEQYQLEITKEPVSDKTSENVDKIFRKNISKDKVLHDYILNCFKLEDLVKFLDNTHSNIVATVRKNKVP